MLLLCGEHKTLPLPDIACVLNITSSTFGTGHVYCVRLKNMFELIRVFFTMLIFFLVQYL